MEDLLGFVGLWFYPPPSLPSTTCQFKFTCLFFFSLFWSFLGSFFFCCLNVVFSSSWCWWPFFLAQSHTLCRLWGCPGFSLERLSAADRRRSTEKTWFSTKFKVQGCSRFRVLVLVSGFRIPGFKISLKISRFQGFRVYNSGLACVAQPTVKAHPPAL